MQPKHIVLILIGFLLTSFGAILFERWLNPPATLPEEYKKEMQEYDKRLNLILEAKKQDDRVINLTDRVIKLYEHTTSGYQSTLRRNDIQIRLIQQEYEKNNKYDTIAVSELLQYVANYKECEDGN